MAADDSPRAGVETRRFRVTTEVMPDGRAIHYYEWPADDDGPAADASPPEPRVHFA